MDTDRRTVLRATAGLAATGAIPGYLQDDGEEDDETVEIGSDIPYSPFEYRDEDDELVGFDVDIAEAIFTDQLERDYEFIATGFDTIIPSLNNGNFRVIMSAMTITEDRAEEVDFSDPYFTAYQTVAVLEGSDVQELADLQGQTVAVQKGTTGEAAAEDLQEEEFDGELTIDSYDQIPEAFNALLTNQAVAVINDNAVNLQFIEDNENVVLLEGEGVAAEELGEDAPEYLTLSVEEYGIAFRQDDDDFREEVNDALAAIREDGTYGDIYEEWFGVRPEGEEGGETDGDATETTESDETTDTEETTEADETTDTEETTEADQSTEFTETTEES